jgi:hypothetical protein
MPHLITIIKYASIIVKNSLVILYTIADGLGSVGSLGSLLRAVVLSNQSLPGFDIENVGAL